MLFWLYITLCLYCRQFILVYIKHKIEELKSRLKLLEEEISKLDYILKTSWNIFMKASRKKKRAELYEKYLQEKRKVRGYEKLIERLKSINVNFNNNDWCLFSEGGNCWLLKRIMMWASELNSKKCLTQNITQKAIC
ncbi:hypothetical protein AAJ76_200055000 [Vairimorpha ceranae]|uniref:Uncharacterized protein n=1 Tax=Vairimorpha ceranae TaxID=40302 RepID=A0A0F9WJ05_9MICR|nr:hypothetical protein AAJ76_200055000 [Vairimorpha ceranae]KAF5141297.1 hypothetical protein G9O61_00g006140 [Vairimorpha ceranae]KKO76530.1 hypothetical protein AAJ76_200055000 [Vairimorpha ceranae]